MAPSLAALLMVGLYGPYAHAETRLASASTVAAVELTIAASLDRIDGTVTITVHNGSETVLETLPLWLFPNRLKSPPQGMDEVDEARVFPEGFDAGRLEIRDVRGPADEGLQVTDADSATAQIRLAQPLPPGGRTVVSVRFTTHVPHRFGPFGHAGGQLTLDGGFFPRLPPLLAGGFQTDSPPGDVCWSLDVTWQGSQSVQAVVNGTARMLPPGKSAHFDGGCVQRVTLLVVPGAHRSIHRTKEGEITLLHRQPRRSGGGGEGLLDLGVVDVHRQVLETAAMGVRLHAGVAGKMSGRLPVFVVAPLRRDIAIGAPGTVLVSDRAFETLPVEKMWKMHRFVILRALLGTLLMPSIHVREPVRWRDRVLDMVAVDLVARWELHRYGKAEGAREILQPGSFVAAVDDVIRAPQLPFQSTWFPVVDDTDPYRDRLTLFSHSATNGRLWRAKLHDRLGDSKLESIVLGIVRGGRRFASMLTRVASGQDAAQYLAQWDGGSPPVNYRLGAVSSGEDDTGPYVDVEVLRDGDPDLDESVTVAVATTGARPTRGTAAHTGDASVIRLRHQGASPTVMIDPDYRLVETDLGQPVHPRHDNRNRHPWRALLRGFSFDVNSVSGRVNTAVSGTLRRSDDLRHSIALRAFDREHSLGASASWLYGFGSKIRANTRRHGIGAGLGVSWLKPTGDAQSGLGVNLSLGVADVTYLSRTDPQDGHFLRLRGGPMLASQASGTTTGVFVEASGRRILLLHASHVLAARLDVGTIVGSTSDNQQWLVGGVGGVRAVGPYAAPGKHRILASVEWRHRFTRNVSIDLLHLAWIEGIDGVLFADGATVADEISGLGDAESLYLGAGYGLRFHYLLAGFRPMVLAVDFGIPLHVAGRAGLHPGLGGSLVIALGQAF